MLRLATLEDVDNIVKMAMNFQSTLPYGGYAESSTIENLATSLIEGNREDGVVIMSDNGFIAAIRNPYVFGSIYVATELGWWVEPEYRSTGQGADLIEAFEFWATRVGCKMCTLISLDDELGKYYEKRGYVLSERAYMKEL